MSMLNPPEREKYVIGAVVKGVAKHAKDILTSPTKGQEKVEKATKGQRATRKAQRKAALASAAGTYGIVKGEEFLSGLSSSAEAKVKENKSGSVTDITSGTMDAAFSKASKNPSTYVFMKSGMPHFKYKGKAVPFSLATEEDDVVLDMTPRTKKNLGSLFEALEGKNVDPKMDRTAPLDPEELIELPGGRKLKAKDLAKIDRGMIKRIPKDFDKDDALLGLFGKFKVPTDAEMEREAKEKEKKKSRFNEGSLIGGQKEIDANNDGDITAEDFALLRDRKVDGGMPVDTYPNIPPEEMEEALASQLPDDDMEEDYIKFVMDESLDDSEQDYLAEALTKDERLSDIMDKVITTASEFSGAGKVEGPGTGVSDSVPARLSDGEFVITKKATDQIGADNLQRMMDDAERAYDGGLQQLNVGGMPRQEEEEELEKGRFDISKTDEEIKKLMIGANKMPSVQ